MENNKNLLIAIVASVAIFVGWHYLYNVPNMERQKAEQTRLQAEKKATEKSIDASPASVIQADAPVEVPKNQEDTAAQRAKRLIIDTPTLKGSLTLRGARFDDLILKNYRETIQKESPLVPLLSHSGAETSYFAEFGWVSGSKDQNIPNADVLWTADQETLTPSQPVTLTWDNGQGLIFEMKISVDENYLFTITQQVHNKGQKPIDLNGYGLISRLGTPKTSGFAILHEGPIGYLDNDLREYSYKDLQEDKIKKHQSTGGWLGITDKYWLSALIPDQKASVKTNFRDMNVDGKDRYQADYLTDSQTVVPGQSISITNHLFAGAKVLEILDEYEEKLSIQNFDKAVDFGKLHFITQPLFYALNWLKEKIGNFGLAILLLTVVLKLLFLPLANKSYRSMARMKEVQPEMERIRNLYGEDKVRMIQVVIDLYKREKVDPMSGCMSMLIRIPVFFALYKVLFVSIEMRQAPFYGWIQDLSAPDPTTVVNLFGLIPWDPPSWLMLGAWPLIMGITMLLQQKLNPPPSDPIQARMFMIMPVVFTIMLAQFPAGLVIYWAWNNVLSIGQQWIIMRTANHKKKGHSHDSGKKRLSSPKK